MGNFEDTIRKLQKKYDDESIFLLSDDNSNLEFISTGILMLNYAIGKPGIPRGRITVLKGQESTLKTSIATKIIANVPDDKYIVYVDAEHTYTRDIATMLGADWERIGIIRPLTGEDSIEGALDLIETGCVGAVVVDSISQLVPVSHIEQPLDKDERIGEHAKLIGRFIKKLVHEMSTQHIALVFINQLRDNISPYGGPVSTGGRMLRYAKTIEIELSRTDFVVPDPKTKKKNGMDMRVRIPKNKIAEPWKEASFRFLWGDDSLLFDNTYDLVNYAIENKFIEQSGAWVKFRDKSYYKNDLVDLFRADNNMISDLLKITNLEQFAVGCDFS